MVIEPAPEERADSEPNARATWRAAVGGIMVAALAGGWFVLSHWVMGNAAGDAVAESLGVAFALLVVISVIGAIWTARRPR
jgi:hypothetical protein